MAPFELSIPQPCFRVRTVHASVTVLLPELTRRKRQSSHTVAKPHTKRVQHLVACDVALDGTHGGVQLLNEVEVRENKGELRVESHGQYVLHGLDCVLSNLFQGEVLLPAPSHHITRQRSTSMCLVLVTPAPYKNFSSSVSWTRTGTWNASCK